jgi:hypothetical protein
MEECEGRFPKQFPVLMDWPEKEEAQPCLASYMELDEVDVLVSCFQQALCQDGDEDEVLLEEGYEVKLPPLGFEDHDGVFSASDRKKQVHAHVP